MSIDKEYAFTRQDFEYLREIVTRKSGILAPDDKYTLYYSRLAQRLRLLGLKSFSEYRNYLSSNFSCESVELVNSVTTNLTSFFREKHHFDTITNAILPAVVATGKKRLRIWSAGCSTGEEPYSIAITLAEGIADIQSWDIKITATDIDTNVINHATNAVYRSANLKSVDSNILQKYFEKGLEVNKDKYRVKPSICKMVDFQPLNLLDQWSFREKFDFIFCRNVVIYFGPETRSKLLARFAAQLGDQGYLFMGHSESMQDSTKFFESLGRTAYKLRD